MDNFVRIESCYGPFMINQHDIHQYPALIDTGVPHIQVEIERIRAIIGALEGPLTVVDGGANAGLITMPVAKDIAASGGTVWSFEPQPEMYQSLIKTVWMQALSNVVIINAGVGSTNRRMWLPIMDYSRPRDFGDVVLMDKPTTRPVDIIPLDALEFPRLDFIKLDIEKMELDALLGCIETIRRCRPWCWVEHIRSDKSALVKFFIDLGYFVYNGDAANLMASPIPSTFPWLTPI